MPNWKKVITSGSSVQFNHITASGDISSSNINAGTPTSNAWGSELEGSYFNNFNSNTNVSEILRFIAGAMSHSLDVSDASPNTQYYNSLTVIHTEGSTTSKGSLLDGVLGPVYEIARLSNSWTGSAFIDLDETGSYRAVQDYLELKGWVQSSDRGTGDNDVGTNPFHGTYASRIPSTIQTNGTFDDSSHTLTGNKGGSTTVYSPGNSSFWGMGPLDDGLPQSFFTKIVATQSFSDNYTDSTPDETSTFTRKGATNAVLSSFGTAGNGVTLAKIETAQPAVIPAAYQDGRFVDAPGTLTGRQYTGGSTDENNISASGYYATHGIKVGIKSGSQSDYVFKNATDSNTRFYLYTGTLPTDITDSQPTAVVSKTLTRTAFSATSRSLSGAPYLKTTTYNFTFNSEVGKSFDPCYGYSTSPLINYKSTDGWNSIGTTTLTNTTTTVNNSGVYSTGLVTYVIDSTKTTKRGSGDIPEIQDIAVASSSFTFVLDNNTENVSQNRSTDEARNYDQAFRARGRNWKNTSVDSTSATQELYDATLFGQHSDSGSMAVYSRDQGYDSNNLQGNAGSGADETFTGEDFRIVLADNVQAFNGAYFTTDSFRTNDEGDAVLGDYDLQVKPGYLVEPGGDYGYWFAEDFGSGTYKYYIRKFQTDGSTYSSMTLNIGKHLVNWTATTSDSVAAVILFESSGNGSGNTTSLSVARIYDPTKLSSNLIEEDMTADNFKNPFSTAISLYGNTGGSKDATTYTIPIRNSDGMILDSNDNQLYVIIRYTGDPDPVENIWVKYS